MSVFVYSSALCQYPLPGYQVSYCGCLVRRPGDQYEESHLRSGALSGDFSVFLCASLGRICFAKRLSLLYYLIACKELLKMSNNKHVINITFII